MTVVSIQQLTLAIMAFCGLWVGSKIVTESVIKLSKLWLIPVFTVSFILLGLLTSLPESSILTSSIIAGSPEVAAGNLFGGVMMLFFFIIPLLAIVKNGIKLPIQLSRGQLIFLLVVVMSPTILSVDRRLDVWEGVLIILLYVALALTLLKKPTLFEKIKQKILKKKVQALRLISYIVIGVGILLLSGNAIVHVTMSLAELYRVPAFFVSLFLLSFGTNLPELSLIVRSVGKMKNDIAFADYLGSASANTLLFGVLALFSQGKELFPNHFLHRFFLIVSGSIILYFFSQSKREISRNEAYFLALFGLLFIFMEVWLLSRMTI